LLKIGSVPKAAFVKRHRTLEECNWTQAYDLYKLYSTVAESTAEQYLDAWRYFQEFCKRCGIKHPVDATVVHAAHYRDMLIRSVVDGVYAPSTAKDKVSYVKAVYKVFVRYGLSMINPFENISFPTFRKSQDPQDASKYPLTDQQFNMLVDYYLSRYQEKNHYAATQLGIRRNVTVLHVARVTGLRNAVFRFMRLGDISLISKDGERQFKIKYTNKGDAYAPLTSVAYLSDQSEAFDFFIDWIEHRQKWLQEKGLTNVAEELVFPSYYKYHKLGAGLGELSRAAVNEIVKKPIRDFAAAGVDINAKKYSFHSLRHTAGEKAFAANGKLAASRLLNHKNESTTDNYVKRSKDIQAQEAAKQVGAHLQKNARPTIMDARSVFQQQPRQIEAGPQNDDKEVS